MRRPDEIGEKVLNYLLVMARPLVMYENDHLIHWSSVYVDRKVSRVTQCYASVRIPPHPPTHPPVCSEKRRRSRFGTDPVWLPSYLPTRNRSCRPTRDISRMSHVEHAIYVRVGRYGTRYSIYVE